LEEKGGDWSPTIGRKGQSNSKRGDGTNWKVGRPEKGGGKRQEKEVWAGKENGSGH